MPEFFSLDVPAVPKSLNQISKRAHWGVFQREKDRLQGMIFIALLDAKLPRPLESVHCEAVLRFPTARRRDEGNFRSVLEKALGDALQLQWLDDDTPEHFTFGALEFDDCKGDPRSLLCLRVERRNAPAGAPRRGNSADRAH